MKIGAVTRLNKVKMAKQVFNKVSMSAHDLIELLKNRQMQFHDEVAAVETLNNIGYYRLSGYWFKYQNKAVLPLSQLTEQNKDIFANNVYFEDIVNVYRFDTKIRSLFLDALEKVEISAGTQICNYMCLNHTPFWHEDVTNFQNNYIPNRQKNAYDILEDEFKKVIDKNKDKPSIKDYYNKYDGSKYPPFWILLQILTFGTVSQIYAELNTLEQNNIANKMKFNVVFLKSALLSLSNARNMCAHYSRFWDRPIKVKSLDVGFATKMSKYNIKFWKDSKGDGRIFAIFYVISLFLMQTTPDSKFCTLVKNTIDRYIVQTHGLIQYNKMGFPSNWENLPLFAKMLRNE